ncbi:hypothetical protein [Microcoleus sp. T3_A4]|uniref:hypothetical protein n=1 Tax=Microcoleus sp. T3_A4 TaxID=2818968 RepID=UPI002FD55A79
MASSGYLEPGLRAKTCQKVIASGCIVGTRFYRWHKADIWKQVLECLQAHADKLRKLDCPVHYVD